MSRILLKDDVTLCREDGSSVNFYIKAHIGTGASCVVYHAVCEDKTEHLLKEYYPRNLDLERNEEGVLLVPEHKREMFDKGLQRFRNGNERQKEVRLLEHLKNSTSNVQGYFHGNGTEYIDMTVFSGQTYNHIESETLHSLMLRMRDLAQAIGNFHSAGFLHLDIKPENIFVLDEDQAVKGIMLFDFDSIIEKSNKMTVPALSYTKDWAAPEQLLPYKRNSICEATDLFSIGEIIFTKIFGRHSTQAERRGFAEYDIDYKAPIFENVNPKVVPLIKELFRHTLCAVPARRYQNAGELIEQLDKIIRLANPETPYLKSSLPSVQDFFVGRENEIDEIHRKLNENRILFLNGIGGIGKSELAKHYALKYKDNYDAIIFAPYVSDVNMLLQDDTAIPLYNFSQYPEEKPEEYCARKLRKLQELCDENTLFIVDNLDREDDPDLNKLLDLGCKLLITSRMDFSNYGYGKQLLVSAISDSDDIYKLFAHHYGDSISKKDLPVIQEIIGLLAGHTMAVELVAKQIEAEWATPQEILKKLKHSGVRTIGAAEVDVGKDSHLSSDNVYGHIKALFDLSVFNCSKRAIEGRVLKLLALLPYTGVDRRLFIKWVSNNQENDLTDKLAPVSVAGAVIGGFTKGITKEKKEISPKATINSLVKGGWVRLDTESKYISLHPLISEIVLDNADDTTVFEGVIKEYTSHLRERNSADSANNQDHCEDSKINVHLLNLIERYNFENSFFEVLLNGIGGELFIVHQYDLALKACELATKIAIKNNPAQSYAVTESMSQMALVKASIGAERKDSSAIREAIEIYLQAIENHKTFDENKYPDNYEEIATLYSYAGMAYEDLEEIDSAREMYGKGISIYLERHVLSADDYLSLGVLYNNLGNTYSGSEALKYYLSAKENHDKSGTLTRHAAITLYHLADVYSCEDDSIVNLDLAVEYAKRALEFFETEYADDLYMIGETKYVLGKVYSRFDEINFTKIAYSLLNEAEEIFVQFLTPEAHTIIKIRELKEKVCQ